MEEEEFLQPKKKKKMEDSSNNGLEEGSGKEGNEQSGAGESLHLLESSSCQQELDLFRYLYYTYPFFVFHGPYGSGKSSLVGRQFFGSNHSSVISLCIDNTVDFKSLIGSYVCSEKIGQFEWKVRVTGGLV